MDDLISRQAAIEAACKGADLWDGGCDRERNRYIEKEIASLPPIMGWIPCSERLPEATGFYICTVNKELFDVRTMKFEMLAEGGYRWLLTNGSEVFPSFVLAWMPLPPAYEGADDGEMA